MSEWAPKRFWKVAEVAPAEGGFAVTLDGRTIRTPAKAPLVVPTRAVADLIAAEWQAQGEKIDPETMPAPRAANAALDKVRGQFDDVAALVAAYGETDLLCYRAASPAALRARQNAAWGALLDWSARRYGVRWVGVDGVMPVAQPPETLARLAEEVVRLSPFALTAFHDLVAMSGSLVIALAVIEDHDIPENLWEVSRIDEDWQAEQWGVDADAEALTMRRRQSFLDAAVFFAALR